MSRIKDDLVCEIIRVSQTNLLSKKKAECSDKSENDIVFKTLKELDRILWKRCNIWKVIC